MAGTVYKIRIILDTDEDVFRDIAIGEQSSLEEFHNTIVNAFGFLGNEMASFYTCDSDWNQDEEIVLFPMDEMQEDKRRMSEVGLDEVLSEESPKLLYIYDFMNMWTFFVELADIVAAEEGETYPLLLFSFGDVPETAPEKQFESDPTIDFEDPTDNYEDLDFEENWN